MYNLKFVFLLVFYICKRDKKEDRAMAISNIHETLLMYTKRKSQINNELSTVMMNILSASRQQADNQARYNDKQQELYFSYYAEDPEQYMLLTEQLEQEHELELATINSWEKELEVSKNNLETQLNEITTFENTWTKLLQTNVKNDFSYGGVQQ